MAEVEADTVSIFGLVSVDNVPPGTIVSELKSVLLLGIFLNTIFVITNDISIIQ